MVTTRRHPGSTLLTIALTLLLAAPAAGSDPAPAAKTLPHTRLEALVAAFAADDEQGYRRFIADTAAAESVGMSDDEFVAMLRGMVSRHGRLALWQVLWADQTSVFALVHGDGGDWLKIALEFEAQAPHALASFSIRPAAPRGDAAPAALRVAPPEVEAAVAAAAQALRADYVLDEQRERLAAGLESQLAAGRYAPIRDAEALAWRVTADLRAIHQDRHLAMVPPNRMPELVAIFEGEDEPGGGHGPGPGGGDDHGFTEVTLHDGDVGYLKMAFFDGSAAGLAHVDEVMRRLQDARALVFDVRGSRGGDGSMVQALSSYLFAEPTLLGKRLINTGSERRIEESWTAPTPLSARFAARPVFVLIDRQTYSAAEGFAAGLRRTGRATLIGDRTAGAGHTVDLRKLPASFGLVVPTGRSYDPDTGEGWEGTGVTPHTPCPPAEALEVALAAIAGSG